MSDGMSYGYRAHVFAVKRAERTYGHLSSTDAGLLLSHHREQAKVMRAKIRILEHQLKDHEDALDDLELLFWEQQR